MIPMRYGALLALAIFVLSRPAAAQQTDAQWVEDCDEEWHGDSVAFCEVRPVDVATSGSLDLASRNGVIDLRGEEQTDVRLRARVRGWGGNLEQARENARAVRVTVDGSRVRAEGPRLDRRNDGGWSVDFLGTLPRRYDVDIESQNGPVSLRDVSGSIEVESQNGPVELVQLGGSVRARAVNGPLTLELTSARVAEPGIDVETQNGPLTVLLPRGIDARLDAGTQNGPISTNLDVDIQRSSRHDVSGEIDATLGDGGGQIRARTSNGPLTVRSTDR